MAAQSVSDVATCVEAVAVTRVPFQFGELAQSSRIDESATSDGAEALLGFYAPYARYQHENALIHTNGRQDHYLSSAITDERANAYKMMALSVKRLIGS